MEEFGSNSCISTKFGTNISNGVTFNFFAGAQKFDHWGHYFSKKSILFAVVFAIVQIRQNIFISNHPEFKFNLLTNIF